MLTVQDALQLVSSKYFAAAGFFYLLRFFIYLVYNAWSGFRAFIWSRLKENANLRTKYGEWAIVTGSTDGIGKEWAKQLAKRGMNIILISRNENKLQATEEEIRQLYGVDVKMIQADFTYTDVYSKISKELEGLDIGILVNNVGIVNEVPEPIADESEEFLKRIVNVNIAATILNTALVIKQMQRKNRGLIINMSSASALVPVPYMGVYSSTKVFVDNYTTCLNSELSGTNIDIKCFRAGFIKTNLISSYSGLINTMEKCAPLLLPNAETYVASAVATLNTDITFTTGYWAHSLCWFVSDTFMCRSFQVWLAKFLLSNKIMWKKKVQKN